MSIFRSGAAAVVALVITVASAQAAFFTYAEFEQMPAQHRALYIAGVFDAYVGTYMFDPAATQTQQHRMKCIGKTKMNNTQLADNVIAFARSRPDLQTGQDVLGALYSYLAVACPEPAKTN